MNCLEGTYGVKDLRLMPKKSQGAALLISSLVFINIIWGNVAPVTKLALFGFSPFTLAAVRILLSTAAFFVLIMVAAPLHRGISRRDIPLIIFLGLVGVTVEMGIQIEGISRTTAINASLLVSTEPAFIAALSALRLREKLGLGSTGGIALAFLGVAVVIGVTPWGLGSMANPAHLSGDLMVLCAAFAWAVYSVFGKEMIAKYPPLVFAAYTNLIGGIGLIPLATWEMAHGAAPDPSPTSMAALAYLVIMVIIVGRLIWFWAMDKAPASRVGMFLYLQPVSGVALSIALLGEQLTPNFLAGVVLVFAGLYLVYRPARQSAGVETPIES